MIRQLTLTSCLLFSVWIANAQISIQGAFQLGMPLSEYSGLLKPGIGGNVKVSFWMDDYLRVCLGSGYYMNSFESLIVGDVKQEIEGNTTLAMIPVTVGAEFYFLGTRADKQPSKIKPYFGLDLGYAFSMQSASVFTEPINRNNVIIAPSFGVGYQLSENLDVFANLRNNIILYEYKDITNYIEVYQLFGVNVGVNYKL